ncbi:hypothetical protein VTI74DRAFT_8137 [Chaetomium olivicolor]
MRALPGLSIPANHCLVSTHTAHSPERLCNDRHAHITNCLGTTRKGNSCSFHRINATFPRTAIDISSYDFKDGEKPQSFFFIFPFFFLGGAFFLHVTLQHLPAGKRQSPTSCWKNSLIDTSSLAGKSLGSNWAIRPVLRHEIVAKLRLTRSFESFTGHPATAFRLRRGSPTLVRSPAGPPRHSSLRLSRLPGVSTASALTPSESTPLVVVDSAHQVMSTSSSVG